QFQLARCYLMNQRGPEAVAALGTCIALRPEAPWAYSTRGLVHGLLGQFAEADSDFAQALRLDAKFRPAHLNRGCICFLQNKLDLALAELDFALEPPSDLALVEAAFYRAQIHFQRGELQDSLRDCETFLVQRPSFSPAHLLAAQIHFRQGDDTQGLHCVDEALACASGAFLSTDSASRAARGRALRQIAMGLEPASQQRVLRLALRDLQSADDQDVEQDVTATKDLLGLASVVVEMYTQRLQSAPLDIVIRKKRAWNYAELKRYELAANDFSIVLEQAPDDAEAHTGLGYVLALQGDFAAAELEAAKSAMRGADDFLVLHNIAAIYAELAAANLQQRIDYEDRAIAFLERAVTLAKLSSNGIDEVELIRGEKAFRQSLRMRPEFRNLLGKTYEQ
ncbi:MAG: tetratricopeptide repeat protein, partial [Planctomycetales bacterium]|nr:tetratricopeptide repeat protein [Planctomycetales bacterium]